MVENGKVAGVVTQADLAVEASRQPVVSLAVTAALAAISRAPAHATEAHATEAHAAEVHATEAHTTEAHAAE